MRKLHSLDAKEISLVGRGANKKKFLITKSFEENVANEKVLKASKEDDKKGDGLSDRAQAALKAVVRILAPFRDEISDKQLDSVQEELGMKKTKEDMDKSVSKEHSDEAMGEAKKAYKAHLEKLGYAKYPDAKVTQKSKSKEDDEDEEDEEDEEELEKSKMEKEKMEKSKVTKSMDEKIELVLKSNQELVQKNSDLEKQLNVEREARVAKEFAEKAAHYTHLSVKSDELAVVMKSVSEKDADAFAKLETILKAANEQIAKGDLFKEVGTRTSASSNSEAKLDALVDSVVQKSDKKVSRAEIYDQVLQTEEGRKIYAEIQSKRPGGV